MKYNVHVTQTPYGGAASIVRIGDNKLVGVVFDDAVVDDLLRPSEDIRAALRRFFVETQVFASTEHTEAEWRTWALHTARALLELQVLTSADRIR